MNLLPQNTHLGKLEILEIYDYYDMPCIFSCKNLSGHIFLAVLSDLTKNLAVWLYVPMSRRRFENIRSGIINLHDAFVNSEDGFVYKVIISNQSSDEIQTIFCEAINEEWLPMQESFLILVKNHCHL